MNISDYAGLLPLILILIVGYFIYKFFRKSKKNSKNPDNYDKL